MLIHLANQWGKSCILYARPARPWRSSRSREPAKPPPICFPNRFLPASSTAKAVCNNPTYKLAGQVYTTLLGRKGLLRIGIKPGLQQTFAGLCFKHLNVRLPALAAENTCNEINSRPKTLLKCLNRIPKSRVSGSEVCITRHLQRSLGATVRVSLGPLSWTQPI